MNKVNTDTIIRTVILAVALLNQILTAAKTDGFADGETRANIRYIKESVDKHDKKLDRVAENYESMKREIVELRVRLEKLEQRVEVLHGGDV